MSTNFDTGSNGQIPLIELDLIDEYQNPSKEEIQLLVTLLLNRPAWTLRNFLQYHKLPVSATKQELRRRVTHELATGRIDATDLIAALDEIEGWGNQHIYLYRSSQQQVERWVSPKEVRAILKRNGLLHLYNRRNPIVLPARPEISSMRHSPTRIRIQWIETHVWEERVPEEDIEDGSIIKYAYERRKARGITTFDWDLISGHAALMIQRLPSGSNYDLMRERFEKELGPLVSIGLFDRLRLSRSISKIEDSGEALRRQYRHEVIGGEVASFTSRGRGKDVFENQAVKKAREALGQGTLPLLGNLYWQPVSGKLDRVIHVKLYPKDQRVGIFGACTESEVRYLLSRIRRHSH